ncbi:MAG: DUF6752 domain-containing protein [Nocardioides sp.]
MGALRDRIRDKSGMSAAIDLRRRVKLLEDEVQECRALSLRLAELTDIVTELLLPVAQRDEAKLEELLERYHRSL